jgi:hypothetical protein
MKKKARAGDRAVRMQGSRVDALGLAIASNDWERAALLLTLGFSLAVQSMPKETIDDVLTLLGEGDGDARTEREGG